MIEDETRAEDAKDAEEDEYDGCGWEGGSGGSKIGVTEEVEEGKGKAVTGEEEEIRSPAPITELRVLSESHSCRASSSSSSALPLW